MKTVCIQIGNSDDKLSQYQWSSFVSRVRLGIAEHATDIYFQGGAPNDARWQNYCFVFSVEDEKLSKLREYCTYIRGKYKQESVAYLEGETEFI